jgi:hypothetical protein
MSNNSQFSVPIVDSDADAFTPSTHLPDHLMEYATLSKQLREKMTPVLKETLELMDKIALRSAALPQSQ